MARQLVARMTCAGGAGEGGAVPRQPDHLVVRIDEEPGRVGLLGGGLVADQEVELEAGPQAVTLTSSES